MAKLVAVRSRGSLPVVTLPHLWAIASLVFVFAATGLRGIEIADFWWHLKVGEIIATTHRIPATDTFSFLAAGTPFVYQQWLGELYLYALHSLGGLEAVALVNALVMTGVAALTLVAAYESSGSLRAAAVCAIVAMLIASPNRDPRPQTLGFLFFALFYLLLSRYRRGAPAPLWLLPPLAAVWANVHGSAVVGLGLCALVLGAEALKAWLGLWPESTLRGRQLAKLGAATAAIPLAMLANPWGPGFFSYVVAIQRNPIIQSYVTEWFPPSLRNAWDLPFFAALLACVAILVLSPGPLDLTDAALFVVFTTLGLQAERNSVWLGIVAAPLAARQAIRLVESWRSLGREASGRAADDPPRRARAPGASSTTRLVFANYLFAALLVGLAATTLPWVKPALGWPEKWRGLIDAETPVEAVRYVGQHYPNERFFHPVTYGSYMIWASTRQPPVFVDGRVELYPSEVWDDYIQISLALNWEARLARYGIRHVLLAKQPYRGFQLELLRELERSPDWQPVYEDDRAVIYARRT